MSDSRIRHASLVNIRQQLEAPVQGLVGYSEVLLEQSMLLGIQQMSDDIGRILGAANELTSVVELLLGEGNHKHLAATENIEDTEHLLRHDLRTPINGIKGYAEMLMEDLDEFNAGSMRSDFESLLSLADQLLGDINTIVRLSVSDPLTAAVVAGTGSATLSADLIDSIRALEDNKSAVSSGRRSNNILGRILVVDDIETNRDLLARRLQMDGHTVVCAAGGQEALMLIREDNFDLVLLDLMMPEINGYEVLTQMKADPELRNIPVIMISALEETDSVIRCIEAGANDYLQKPFNLTLLRARINSGLHNKQWTDDERDQRRFIHQAFSRFVSPTVVDQLLADPDRLRLGGERVELSCVFTDLAGFTSAIEQAEPGEIMPVLNRYLSALCDIVLDHEGTIDKIVGDSLYVFFNAPLPRADHAEAAVRCAIALQQWAEEFSHAEDAQRFNFGATRIGIHTGSAVVGNFGGESFFNYTAYGDTVNTTARLEDANKHFGTTICVSAETVSRCPDFQFRPIGKLLLKGKTQPVEAYELTADDRYSGAQLNQYKSAYDLLENSPAGAKLLFEQLADDYPYDPLARFHCQRISSGNAENIIVFDAK